MKLPWGGLGKRFMGKVEALRESVAQDTAPAPFPVEHPAGPRPKGQHALTDEQQVLVVKCLAEFQEPTAIARRLTADGVAITPGGIEWYKNSPKFQSLFLRLRESYIKRVAEIPIAHQRVRLERYEQLYQSTSADPDLTEFKKRESQRAILLAVKQELSEAKVQVQNLSVTTIGSLPTKEVLERHNQLVERLKAINIPTEALDGPTHQSV